MSEAKNEGSIQRSCTKYAYKEQLSHSDWAHVKKINKTSMYVTAYLSLIISKKKKITGEAVVCFIWKWRLVQWVVFKNWDM